MHVEREEVTVTVDGEEKVEMKEVKRVYEQRWSSFLHAGAILAFVAPPFQKVLGLTPTSVLAGLFMFMGEQSLSVKCISPTLSPLPFLPVSFISLPSHPSIINPADNTSL